MDRIPTHGIFLPFDEGRIERGVIGSVIFRTSNKLELVPVNVALQMSFVNDAPQD